MLATRLELPTVPQVLVQKHTTEDRYPPYPVPVRVFLEGEGELEAR